MSGARRRLLRRFAAAAPLLALAACSGLLPAPAAPPPLFHLTPLDAPGDAGPAVSALLTVDTPSAPAALDTQRIALARGPLSFDYFANAAWTDRATSMLQSLIIETLENSGRIRAVARDSPELRADALLMTALRHFEADYSAAAKGPPRVSVRFDCQLVKMPERTILAAKSFRGSADSAANDLPAIVAAFDAALHDAMQGLAGWTAASLARR